VLSDNGTLGSAAGTSIGSGSKPGGTVGVVTVVGVEIFAGLWSAISLKVVDCCCRATCWLSLMSESGEAGDGCKRAEVKSRAAAMAASVDEDFGIETFVGNQTTVSAMWSRESKPGNNGNIAWQGLRTIHQRHVVTTFRGALAFRGQERGCQVVPGACG
jgi:hypothetical protein